MRQNPVGKSYRTGEQKCKGCLVRGKRDEEVIELKKREQGNTPPDGEHTRMEGMVREREGEGQELQTPMLSLAMFFCLMGEPLAGAHISKSWSHSLPLRQSMSLRRMPPRNSFGCDVSFVSCSLMLMSLPLCTATIMQHRVWRRLTIIMRALNILKKKKVPLCVRSYC